jgi:HK97 family phage prohead protease
MEALMPESQQDTFFKTILTEFSNDNVKVFMVDGSTIRDPLTKPFWMDFNEGDNDAHNPDLVPPGEAWIDLDVAPTEVRCTILHELTERRYMIEDGLVYDDAHDKANEAEEFGRSHRDQLNELCLAELKLAPAYKSKVIPNVEAKNMPITKQAPALIYKSFRATVIKFDDTTGIIDMLIPMNSGKMDRSDEICTPKSWEKHLPLFMKRPILVSSHTYDDLRKQIGEFVTLKVTPEGLLGTPQYYINDGNAEADWAYKLAKRGMAAFSVGFKPIEMETAKKESDPAVTYTESELYEISQVVVPCDRNAIQNGLKKSVNPIIDELYKEVLADKELTHKDSQAEIADQLEYTLKLLKDSKLNTENIVLAKSLFTELKRITGPDTPDEIKATDKCHCEGCKETDCKCKGEDCTDKDCQCKCHTNKILQYFQTK